MREPVRPKGWKDVSMGNVRAFCRPGYEKLLLSAWRIPRKGENPKEGNNENLHWFMACIHKDTQPSDSAGKLAGLRIHSAIRLESADIEDLEKARKAGVRVEKPLAVIYLSNGKTMHVLKRIPGVKLSKFLSEEKSAAKRKKALADVIGQLDRLHSIGMYHGDCHGGNIMVTPAGRAHLIDLMKQDQHYEPVKDLRKLRWSLGSCLSTDETAFFKND